MIDDSKTDDGDNSENAQKEARHWSCRTLIPEASVVSRNITFGNYIM